MEKEKKPRILETKKRAINKGKTTSSINLPKYLRTAAVFLKSTSVEIRTVQDQNTGEIYGEIRLIKEEENKNAP